MMSAVVSVPLRGLWFLSILSKGTNALIRGRFRPLAGIMVLIYLDNCTQKSRQLRFRPLAGIMVLIVFVKHSFV